MTNSETEGYIHIPFCAKKCSYCDFLSFPCGREKQQLYVDALIKEIESRSLQNRDYRMRSVFLGGGTPSLLEYGLVKKIMDSMYENYDIMPDAEITIEANPCTLDERKLDEYLDSGINRISIGCQSTNDKQLKMLGRLHDSEGFFKTMNLVKKSGFENINIDLMSGLPDQTLAEWKETLCVIAELGVSHISAYSLIIEEGTRFFEIEEELNLPEESIVSQMYQSTAGILNKYGFIHYEISNYSLPNFESRHNLGYWQGIRYEGFGLGASSFEDNTRFSNTTDFDEYINNSRDKRIRRDIIKLTKEDLYSEFMILGLRLIEGISENEFKEKFNVTLESVFGDTISKHVKQGTLARNNGRIFIPEKYLFVSNQILADFI